MAMSDVAMSDMDVLRCAPKCSRVFICPVCKGHPLNVQVVQDVQEVHDIHDVHDVQEVHDVPDIKENKTVQPRTGRIDTGTFVPSPRDPEKAPPSPPPPPPPRPPTLTFVKTPVRAGVPSFYTQFSQSPPPPPPPPPLMHNNANQPGALPDYGRKTKKTFGGW